MKTEANLQKTETVNKVMGIKCHHLQVYGGHSLTREERLTTNRISGIMIGWMGVAVLIGMECFCWDGANICGINCDRRSSVNKIQTTK